ncbi:hypothetical protein [Bradyrhizobium diversitatis]|uniref:Lipocalin-like domain-containing protein n=1 Tax=Bradyrhizobium diversitatis TaxID=2755406 RepID=A0ABS0PC85_9BRAD|nr:hypothetical protein [Bradyrhizobium diversitatis]MBH5390901.1 hypothetical protein [Bradyrhizobium diversitatis]
MPILALVSAIAFLHSTAGQGSSSLEGTWEGKLEVAYSGSSKDPASDERIKAAYAKSPFRIRINQQRASVYFGGEEVKPGLFQYQAYMTNAVIFASSAGEDRDGRWVETWNFTLTEKISDTMIACFSRVVNNLDLGETKDAGKFGLLAVGEFHRTPN